MLQRVLIVDDHLAFRTRARQLLETEGFEVVGEAADGTAALEAANSLDADVVLVDVHLPDIDGFEVAKQLASDGSGPAIVLISSRDGSDFGRLIEDSGARGFIVKDELSGERLRTLLA